jgi:hypothetical protein
VTALGIRQVIVKTTSGTTTNSYPLSPLLTDLENITNPAVAFAGTEFGFASARADAATAEGIPAGAEVVVAAEKIGFTQAKTTSA